MEKAKSMSAQLIEVIEVKTSAGKGTESNPNRIITEYWSKEGVLLAVNDPHFNPYEHQPSLG